MKANPVTQVVDATRNLLLSSPATEYAFRAIIAWAVPTAMSFPLALLLYLRQAS